MPGGVGVRRPEQRVGSATRFVRLAFRKGVRRKVLLGRWSVRAAESHPPPRPTSVRIELVGPKGFAEVLAANPHLDQADIDRFRAQRSVCIVARDGDRIVANSWMTAGTVFVSELQRTLQVPDGEHFSCRSYVADSHRGQSLLGHMVHAYAATVAPGDLLWGLVYPWNVASIRSLEASGWRQTGAEWTTHLFDRPIGGSRRHPAAPPLLRAPEPGGTLPPCLLVAEETWSGTIQAARSLARVDVPVLVATCGTGAAVYRRSRAVAAATDIVADDPGRFCEQVVEWVGAQAPGEGPVAVIPLSDRLVSILHEHRDRFPARFRLAIPPAAATAALLDKEPALALAERAGIAVPATVVVRTAADIPAAGSVPLPVIIRPTSWSTTGDRYFKLLVCRTEEERDRGLRQVVGWGAEVLVQHYLGRPDATIDLAIAWRSADGSTTAICTGRKHRQAALDGGVMAWGEAQDLPDVREATEAFLDVAGFTGLGGLEVIRQDGRLWFVEFNPRLESIHFLAAAAGVDTVVLAYRDLALGEVVPVPTEPEPAAAWIGSAWFDRIRRDPDGWRLALADRRAFGRVPNHVRSVWDPKDPGPGLAILLRLSRRAIAAMA